MKKVFGIILIIVGFITILKYFFSHDDVVGYEIIGVIIGITIVTFLPAYFLMKSKKKVQDSNANKRLLKTTGIILIIIGALNIFRGVITLTSAPFEFHGTWVYFWRMACIQSN